MRAETVIERGLLASRWLLVPLYGLLLLVLLVFAVKAAQELLHIVTSLFVVEEAQLVLAVLSLIDMVLVANLVVMVALSGYETFVSPFDKVGGMERPGWLGKLDPGTVKLKVAASIVAISAIHLLKQYMNVANFDAQRILVLTGVHLAFVTSALMLAFVDRLAEKPH
jgi:uncharacterized protein (TIGR00645 family)